MLTAKTEKKSVKRFVLTEVSSEKSENWVSGGISSLKICMITKVIYFAIAQQQWYLEIIEGVFNVNLCERLPLWDESTSRICYLQINDHLGSYFLPQGLFQWAKPSRCLGSSEDKKQECLSTTSSNHKTWQCLWGANFADM